MLARPDPRLLLAVIPLVSILRGVLLLASTWSSIAFAVEGYRLSSILRITRGIDNADLTDEWAELFGAGECPEIIQVVQVASRHRIAFTSLMARFVTRRVSPSRGTSASGSSSPESTCR
jgi:hypothetical protein